MANVLSIRIGFVIAPLAVALAAAGGCSMPKASDFKPSKLFSLKDDEEPEKGTPTRIVSTWTDTVLSQPGKTPQRGFGGRLMFYERNEEKPILVEGQLVVYAFDETNRAISDNKPTRRYVFPPEQLPRHMSKSELGASYSFWLPWDEAGGPQTEVSLICRFEARGGTVVTSEQTRHRLPGNMAPAAMTADGRPAPPKLPEGVPSRPSQPTLESVQQHRMVDRNVQLASYESAVGGNAYGVVNAGAVPTPPFDSQPQMTTTSIALPPNYQLPMGAVAAGPMPAQATGMPRQAVQSLQQQPMTLQQQLPAMSPTTPAHHPLPAAIQAIPGAYAPTNAARFGAFPAQRPGMPTVATPTIATPTIATPTLATPTVATPTTYSPTSGGFGFGYAAASQPPQASASQPTLPQQPGGTANLRTHAWNNVQKTTLQYVPGNMALVQQPVNGTSQLPPAVSLPNPQTITQPASQPLPQPTGLTTTVSYPTPPIALQ